jgi:hypothetical protein
MPADSNPRYGQTASLRYDFSLDRAGGPDTLVPCERAEPIPTWPRNFKTQNPVIPQTPTVNESTHKTSEEPMSNENQKCPVLERAVYGFGDLASCLFWQTITLYLLFFYTDVFGLSAAAGRNHDRRLPVVGCVF